MDSFELNKIIAAVLLVALLIIGLGKLSNIIFHVEKPKTPGYVVEVEKTVATNIASNICMDKLNLKKKNNVLFFSLEMSSEQLATRLLSEMSKIPSEKIRTGSISKMDVILQS